MAILPTVRTPSIGEILEIAGDYGITLSEDDAASFQGLIKGLLPSYWRCDELVLTRHLTQWFFRLSAYAPEIWQETEQGAYPDHIATMLRD